MSSFALSARLYALCASLADAQGQRQPTFVRRMVPLAIEFDGNLMHGRGEHRRALLRWIDALERWQMVQAWLAQPPAQADATEVGYGRDSAERNEGRLRRRAILLAERLALDPATGRRAGALIEGKKWDEARAACTGAGWREVVPGAAVRWLGEPDPPPAEGPR
jgi:hypothetical protein